MMIRLAIPLAALLLATPAWAGGSAPAADHAAHDHATTVAESRFVIMEGGRNFRDVGGYKTADGHVVKSGVMYRSGSLGKLTPAGQAKLASLHITDQIDLRTPDERSRDTFDLPKAIGPGYWTRDYEIDRAGMGKMPDLATLTRPQVEAMMSGAYRGLAQSQTPAYRELFARLQTAKGPLIVNCTAGKDRTGIGTALVLTALGVPYETVRSDFLLSNGAPGMDTLSADLSPMFAKIPADIVAPLIGVEGVYLDTAFAELREQYGSIEGYMEKELGVGPKEIAALRHKMLK